MRFYVINHLLSGFQHAPINTEGFPNAPTVSSVMWVPFPRTLDTEQLDFFIANIPSFVLRSDITVIGLHPRSMRAIEGSDHILDDVGKRIENAPLYIVCHEHGQPVMKHISGSTIEGLETSSTLDRIRQQDVAEVVRRPGSELPRHPGVHYEGPNKDHYEAFLRPGFATQATEELDRIAFWLAPMLGGRTNVLVDHWSMIAIAYHVGSYSNELGHHHGVTVQSLRNYDENIDLLVDRLKSTFGPIQPHQAATGAVLLSVNSSGRLANNLLFPAMDRVGFENPVGIAIARSPSRTDPSIDSGSQIHSLTTLDESFMRQPADECKVCSLGNATLIPIQHDSYLLNLAAHTQAVDIKSSLAKMSTEMVNRYRDIGAFHVHRTHTDGRHHAFFVDLKPILQSRIFKQRLSGVVSQWKHKNIEIVLHPRHDTAKTLAHMVADELGVPNVVGCDERSIANNDKFRELSCDEKDLLLASRRICLVDDAVITGSRVRGYLNCLKVIRRIHRAGEFELYCIVGVARTRSEKALMGVSDMVHHSDRNPRFLSVEKLFLPNWDQSECRWCAELQILGRLPRYVQDLGMVFDRLQALRRPEGFTTGLFLPWTSDDRNVADRYWKLGRESVFGEVQGADLAVSVAASVQRLRGRQRQPSGKWSESQLDEVFRSPLAKVLDSQLYIAGRYYEPVLVASILRASRRHDIRAPGNDSELRNHVESLASAESSSELHGELVLAIALNQLPRNRNLDDAIKLAHPDIAALVQSMTLPPR